MNKAAVQFGAGKIGRGFFGDLLNQAGYEVVLIDVRKELVASLNRHQAYPIQWVSGEMHVVRPVHALHVEQEEAIADAVAEATLICTAVGVNALPAIAPLLAQGIMRGQGTRGKGQGEKEQITPNSEQSEMGQRPLNIFIGENDANAHQTLRRAVRESLPAGSEAMLEEVGFVRCVISRMVFEEMPGDPPVARAEQYPYLPVDADSLRGEPPPLPGLRLARPFEAYIRRKLYLHNGIHAVLAYLGYERGHAYIHEAMADPVIRALVEEARDSLEHAFLKAYPFDPAEYRAEAQDLLNRFGDPRLQDPIRRVARDPLRKLRSEDRLSGAVHFLREQGEDATPFLKAIRAALHFRDPEDPASLQLGEWLHRAGETTVLKELCGL